jgi:ATP-dependent DNA helicase PIF1
MTDSNQIDLTRTDLPDLEVELTERTDEECLPPVSFITGIAGSGKTFSVKQRVADDPKWGLICSTTGVSAVNLGTITLNSALGFFDTASLEDKFMSGYLRTKLHQLAKVYRNLVIDEVSMMDARQLDMIHEALRQVNEFKDVQSAMGIVAVGDFCQLPAVNAAMAFEAECWPRFEANTERLTKCWRQGEGPFLDGLNALRRGDGPAAAELLSGIVQFKREADQNFDGTTIVATNDQADRYNWLRYTKLKGDERAYLTTRWGKSDTSKLIPDALKLKVGALVMILTNDSPAFTYVNGDLGHVEQLDQDTVSVKLERNGAVVHIGLLERRTEQRHAPEEFDEVAISNAHAAPGTRLPDGSFYDKVMRRWVRGAVTYMPLRLGYASTTFKSQGLSLDKVQVDMRHAFMGSPGQLYVACSRARTAQGLSLVGDKAMMIKRCKVEPKVQRWL